MTRGSLRSMLRRALKGTRPILSGVVKQSARLEMEDQLGAMGVLTGVESEPCSTALSIFAFLCQYYIRFLQQVLRVRGGPGNANYPAVVGRLYCAILNPLTTSLVSAPRGGHSSKTFLADMMSRAGPHQGQLES